MLKQGMPDGRRHRGPHPKDEKLFAPEQQPILQAAVSDLSWLLERHYPPKSALQVVGDRYSLRERQRRAVRRAACSDAALQRRTQHRCSREQLKGAKVSLDGFNLLITVEAALSSGVLLRCRDGCLRDMASIHGSWRSVQETQKALLLIAETLDSLGILEVHWWLDRPVSNSGRLKTRLLKLAEAQNLSWQVELVFDPDPILKELSEPVATADSGILDEVDAWFNLASWVVERHSPESPILNLRASVGAHLLR